MSLWGELKRRNVVKVAVAYAIVAWLLVQIADTLLPVFQAPDWVLPVFVLLLAMGFAVALVLSWAYELTPDGIERTNRVPLAASGTHATGRKLSYIVSGLLTLAVMFLVVENYVLPDRPEVAATKSIVVLPFENLSADPAQNHFADGLSAELLNSLDGIDELRVTPLASTASLRNTDRTIPEIAELLGVEYLLKGSVNRPETSLRISVQILSRDGSQLRSIPYDRRPGDILEIQQNIAREVASTLEVELGFEDEVRATGTTDDAVAQQLYLSAGGRSMVGTAGQDVIGSLDLIERALERDPDFALAWIRKAELHRTMGLFPGLFSNSTPAEQWALAEEAARRAVGAAPELAAAHNLVATLAFYQGEWRAAAVAFQQAEALGAARDILFRFAVGHIPDIERISESGDPLNAGGSWLRIAMLDAAGAMEESLAEYERGREVFTNWNEGHFQVVVTLIESPEWTGQVRAIADQAGLLQVPQVAAVLNNLGDPDDALAAMRRGPFWGNCASGVNCIAGAALAYRLGDSEFALALLREGVTNQPAQLYLVWRPAFKGMRETDAFQQLMLDIGVVDYWREFGWPTLCQPISEDDFRCR
jgi:TolB-like protein/tetratricopeptide (TPR) repeat protein